MADDTGVCAICSDAVLASEHRIKLSCSFDLTW
jgi:hypothetical protein